MRRNFAGLAALALTALLFGAGEARAQQGVLVGTVVDAQSGVTLPDVDVTISGSVGAAIQTVTDGNGRFRVSVASGTYSVEASYIGRTSTRVDGVTVAAGSTESVTLRLSIQALTLQDITVETGRGVEENFLRGVNVVNIVPPEAIKRTIAITTSDYVRGIPGVDNIQTSISSGNIVARGFNNVFSGALLVLSDHRYARVPSLRLNAYNMIPATSLDIERVEVLLGPASALYGPNSANGVMHFLTSSPIDNPGTRMSIGGGERSIFQGAFRQAWDFNGQAGLKVSGQYTRGNDFEYVDPAEPAPGTEGARDYFVERYGGEARLDLRPWGESADDGEIVISYGLNNLGSSVELTGIGAGQARDWMYQFGQVRLSKGGLFVQGFLNKSDAGETYLLRTQQPIVDRSTFMAGQARYSFAPTDGLEVVMGSDVQKTNPVTDRTINGRNEDDDNVFEAGGYLHATLALSDKVDLVGAIRADHHSELEDPVYSPRAALMFNPNESTNFRLTYNRAFSTPSNNNLFLDLVAGRVPLFGSFGYDVRTRGVPESGFTWEETCAGGVSSYCMYSPFAAGTQLPANGVVLWDGVIVPVILQDPALQAALGQLGLTPAQFATIIGNPSLTDMTSYLLRFNSENPSVPFIPDPGVSPVARIRPTITNTFEAGYRGVVDGGRLAFSVTGYHTRIKDFVGPLRVETPNVFLEGTSVGAFLVGRMVGAGIPAPVAQQIAGGIAGQVATVPWGTVAADQMDTHDLLLTYKNFGDVQLWGADVGFEYHATEEVTFTGSFSWVDNDCFDFNEDGDCGSASDVALNAPTKKGSFGIVVSPEASGVTLGGRVRSSAGFPMNSGVYVGNVDNYTVVDANVSYQIPGNYDARVVLSVNNLFNKEHQEFIGAPRIGRLALVKLEYAF